MGIDFGNVDTVAKLPGYEMVPFETRYRGVKRIEPVMLRLGRSPRVAPWASGFVSATGEGLVDPEETRRQARRPSAPTARLSGGSRPI